jgi:hypothetical protein
MTVLVFVTSNVHSLSLAATDKSNNNNGLMVKLISIFVDVEKRERDENLAHASNKLGTEA